MMEVLALYNLLYLDMTRMVMQDVKERQGYGKHYQAEAWVDESVEDVLPGQLLKLRKD